MSRHSRAVAVAIVAIVVATIAPHSGSSAPVSLSARVTAVGAETFEPTIGADPKGNLYYAVTPGPGPLVGFTAGVFKSSDQGRTWSDVTPRIAGQAMPPETNDPYIYVDPGTGRVFSFHMSPILTCSILSWSDDGGQSWATSPYGCGPTAVWDHQTMVAAKPRVLPTRDYPNILHQCVNSVYAVMCSRSLDGGLTWSPGTPAAVNEPLVLNQQFCGSQHGHLEAAPDGTVYLPTSRCGTAPQVLVSRDDGMTWSASVMSDRAIDFSDPDCAVDSASNVYCAFVEEGTGHVLFVSSRDGGRTWSRAVQLSPPGVTGALPAVAAGDPRKVAISFFGTDDLPQGYATPGYAAGAKAFAHLEWGGYLSITLDGLARTPRFDTVLATGGDPLERGASCSTFPMRCNYQLDFLDIVVAPDGRPYATFVDGCTGTCTGPGGRNDDVQNGQGVVATLTSGPLLRNCRAPASCRPG